MFNSTSQTGEGLNCSIEVWSHYNISGGTAVSHGQGVGLFYRSTTLDCARESCLTVSLTLGRGWIVPKKCRTSWYASVMFHSITQARGWIVL